MSSFELTSKKMKMDREIEMPPPFEEKNINDLAPENLGQILRSGLSVIDRLHCSRVSRHWKWAVGEFGWTQEKKLDREIVFEGASEQQKERFTSEHLLSMLRHIAGRNDNNNNLVELDLRSFALDHQEEYAYQFLNNLEPFVPQIAESLKKFQKLEKLHIKYFDLADFVEFLFPTLRILKTWGQLTLQTLEKLSERCLKLEKVPFNRVEGITFDIVNGFIRKFPRLKRLNLRAVSSEGKLETIAELKDLQVLKLWDCEALGAEYFEAIIKGCTGLRKFSCRDISPLTEASLLHFAELPNLVEIEINDKNGAFTDSVLRAIAQRGKLKRLEAWNSDLGDDSIIFLVEQCKSLVSLNVCGCSRITDRSLEAIVGEIHRRYGMPPRTSPAGLWADAIWDKGVFFLCGCLTEIDEEKAREIAAENPWLAVDFDCTSGDPRRLIY